MTYVATGRGFGYTALVMNAYARRMGDWRVSSTVHTSLVLDALDRSLHQCRRCSVGHIHHSAGTCSPSRYATATSRGTRRWAYCALGGQRGRLLRQRTGRVHHWTVQRRSDCTVQAMAALQGGGTRRSRMGRRCNHRRLFYPLGQVPSAGFKAQDYHPLPKLVMAAGMKQTTQCGSGWLRAGTSKWSRTSGVNYAKDQQKERKQWIPR